MAESLGEAFVEVLADTGPFGDSLESGISSAMDGVEASVSSAFDEIPDIADSAFADTVSSADSAAEEIGGRFQRMSEAVEQNLGKIAAGAAVGGAGLEAFARSQRDTRVDARNLAAQLGMTDDEVMDLIASTSNATFPLEDVAALMQSAARRGLEGGEAISDFANFWDMVGDATGESAVALGKASVALGQVGIGAGEEGEALDAFGFIMNNTESSVNDFMRMLGMVGSELGENTPSVNEMAGALAALEEEGFDARRAQSELRRALSQTEGDMAEALATLGISEDAYRAQAEAVEGSGSAIEGNAERFAEARTPVENMTAAIQAQLFRMPMLAEGAAALAGPLAAVGPAAMGFTHGLQAIRTISGGFTKALGAMRAGFVKLGAVILANPIFLIGALLIGVAVLVWKFRDEILEALVGAWEFVREMFQKFWDWFTGAVESLVESVTGFFGNLADRVRDRVSAMVEFVTGLWDRLREMVSNAVNRVRDVVVRVFTRLVDGVRNLFQRWWDWYSGLWRRIFDLVRNAVNNVRTAVTEGFQRAVDGARERFNNLIGFVRGIPRRILDALGNMGRLLKDAGRNILQGLWDGMREIWDRVSGWVGGIGDRIRNLKGPLSYDRVMLTDIGEAIIGGLGRGMQDEFRDVERMLGGMTASIPVAAEMGGGLSSSMGIGQRSGMQLNVTINNPTPEPAFRSTSREMRKLAAIGVFGD